MDNSIIVVVSPENLKHEVPVGTKAGELLPPPRSDQPQDRIIAARIDNEVISLQDGLAVDGTLEPVVLGSSMGIRVYRRTLCFLAEIAARSVFPERRLKIGHSLGHAFYYKFADDGPVMTTKDVRLLDDTMRRLSQENHPILPGEMSWAAAVAYFKNRPYPATAQLLEELNQRRVGVWKCAGRTTLRHAPKAPSTGMIDVFALVPYEDGILLRYPPSSNPGVVENRDDEPKLFAVYKEYSDWGDILGVSSVAQLNALSRNRAAALEFIQTAEALHDRKIAELTGAIMARRGEVKAVMIAGPSSSGKTTFTKKLALSLRSAGAKPQLISLDDYYKERVDIPLDDEGKPDFEVLEALDVPLFNENLLDLFAGKETEIPIFDFKKVGGRLEKGRHIRLDDDGLLLFEGIHGLNPDLTPGIDKKRTYRIYISALTQLNLDDHDRIPTTDNRLIRRIVRDHQFRRYPAVNTIKMWPSVRRGEERHIFPHQGTADSLFNSALDYELAVLKTFAEPLLRTVRPDQREYGEARRLLSFLRNFSPFPAEEVPEYSILREFIGRSGFRY